MQFEPEHRLLPLLCRRDMLSVDIGANMGEYTFSMAKHSRAVVAFEPNLDLWPHLRRLLGPAVRLESAALSDRSGSTTFRYVDDNTGIATVEAANTLVEARDRRRIRTRDVPLRTLDSFQLDDVAFIKIDVEGHEESVLRGAADTISRNQPILLIESEDRHNPGAPARVRAMLEELGYRGFYVQHDELRHIAALQDRDRDPANVATENVYINNYLYVPNATLALLPTIGAQLRTRGR
ncbi:MAG: FkbM family methyltransferase [Gemmatimonas sp.]